MTFTKAQTVAGRVLYDAFGGVLTRTAPISNGSPLTGTLPPGMINLLAGQASIDPDAGLVYLGNGRYFDPLLGLPLQPNPVGGVPTVPQSLNRYAATAFGQPGVAEASFNEIGFAQGLINAAGQNTLGGLLALPFSVYAESGTVGMLTIKANKPLLKKAGYVNAFTYKGKGEFVSQLIEEVEPRLSYRLVHGTDAGKLINLPQLQAMGTKRWGASFVEFQLERNSLQRFLGSTAGEFLSGSVIELGLAIPELAEPWRNPYFNPTQRVIQNSVTVAGAVTSAGVGAYVSSLPAVSALGGPATFVIGVGTGLIVYVGFEYLIKPGVSFIAKEVIGTRDPYEGYRDLRPLGGQN